MNSLLGGGKWGAGGGKWGKGGGKWGKRGKEVGIRGAGSGECLPPLSTPSVYTRHSQKYSGLLS